MSGRAGRRGIDTFGLVIMLIDESIEAETVKGIVFGDADPLVRCSAQHAAGEARSASAQWAHRHRGPTRSAPAGVTRACAAIAF
jgi:hypothetical protein